MDDPYLDISEKILIWDYPWLGLLVDPVIKAPLLIG